MKKEPHVLNPAASAIQPHLKRSFTITSNHATVPLQLILFWLALSFTARAQHTWQWATTPDSTCYSTSHALDMAYDNQNNIVLTGTYTNTLGIGNASLAAYGGGDCFTASITKNGNLNWLARSGGGANDFGKSICTDHAGNVYVMGSFDKTLTAGPAVITHTGFAEAAFLIKYNPAGNVIWAKKIAEGMVHPDLIRHYAGKLYFSGSYGCTPTVPFRIGDSTYSTNRGWRDIFLAKLDTSGLVLSSTTFGGNGEDEAGGLCINTSGDVYISGSFTSTIFPIGSFTLNHSSGYKKSIFLAKIGPNGNVTWARAINGVGPGSEKTRISTDGYGNIALAGSFASPGFTVDNLQLSTSSLISGMLLKFNGSGNALWARSFAGSSPNYAESCYSSCFNQQGDLYVSGSFRSASLTIGSTTLTNAGSSAQLYIAHYSGNGSLLGTLSAGSQYAFAEGLTMLSDASDNLHLGGRFGGKQISFAPLALAGLADQTYDRLFVAQAMAKATGLNEMPESWGIVLSPNPATDQVRITCDNTFIENIQVFDLSGKNVLSVTGAGPSQVLLLNQLSKGLYLVKIKTTDQRVQVKKLLKAE